MGGHRPAARRTGRSRAHSPPRPRSGRLIQAEKTPLLGKGGVVRSTSEQICVVVDRTTPNPSFAKEGNGCVHATETPDSSSTPENSSDGDLCSRVSDPRKAIGHRCQDHSRRCRLPPPAGSIQSACTELRSRKRGKPVRKTGRNIEKRLVLSAQFDTEPFAKSCRACAKIDGNIQDPAGGATDKLGGRRRHILIMQAANNSDSRARMRVLNEVTKKTSCGEVLLIPAFNEKPPVILEVINV